MKYLTPQLLRKAQTYLHPGIPSSEYLDYYTCHTLKRVGASLRAQEEYKYWLIDQKAATANVYNTDVSSLYFSPGTGFLEQQAIRFMLLEFLALDLESRNEIQTPPTSE